MAERRMFALNIVDSDAFLSMPQSAQSLYFHLGMRADDEGFINGPRKISRMVGSSVGDLDLLIEKRYLLNFDSGIVVVKHWELHNKLRKDRMKKTLYTEEFEMLHQKENGAYTFNKENKKTVVIKSESVSDDLIEDYRKIAYKNSSLPYSFEYKIKEKFYGKECPVCNCKMVRDEFSGNKRIPSIQHNTPLSKGGLHELGNIAVICKDCNVTIKADMTSNLNENEVITLWDDLCLTNDGQLTAESPSSVVKVRLEEVSVVKVSKDNNIDENSEPVVVCKYKSVFDYYQTLDLVHHRAYTPEMTKAIKKAEKSLNCDMDHLKKLLDRHVIKVNVSKGCDYETKARPLTEFFGQKKYESTELICSEYDVEKWIDPVKETFMKKAAPVKSKNSFHEFKQHDSDPKSIDKFLEKKRLETIEDIKKSKGGGE